MVDILTYKMVAQVSESKDHLFHQWHSIPAKQVPLALLPGITEEANATFRSPPPPFFL